MSPLVSANQTENLNEKLNSIKIASEMPVAYSPGKMFSTP